MVLSTSNPEASHISDHLTCSLCSPVTFTCEADGQWKSNVANVQTPFCTPGTVSVWFTDTCLTLWGSSSGSEGKLWLFLCYLWARNGFHHMPLVTIKEVESGGKKLLLMLVHRIELNQSLFLQDWQVCWYFKRMARNSLRHSLWNWTVPNQIGIEPNLIFEMKRLKNVSHFMSRETHRGHFYWRDAKCGSYDLYRLDPKRFIMLLQRESCQFFSSDESNVNRNMI